MWVCVVVVHITVDARKFAYAYIHINVIMCIYFDYIHVCLQSERRENVMENTITTTTNLDNSTLNGHVIGAMGLCLETLLTVLRFDENFSRGRRNREKEWDQIFFLLCTLSLRMRVLCTLCITL